MVIMTPALAAIALQILPSIAPFVGELTGKKKEGEILGTILSLPGMAAGVLGKSPSIAKTPTSTEGSGLQIGKGITSEAGSLTDLFKPSYSRGGANLLQIGGDPTQPGLFKQIEPMYGIGAGWGM